MKRVLCFILLLVCIIPINVNAQRGCCSHHGGVAGCSGGRQLCNDGTLNPSCVCDGGSSRSRSYSNNSYSNYSIQSQPTYVYGCTDRSALNYNDRATKDDGSCIQKVEGCMDASAKNYNSAANVANGSCQFEKEVKETKKITYETKYIYNDELLDGEKKVKTNGVKGQKEITYIVVVDEKGNELSRKEKNSLIVKKPVNEIIEKGTKKSDDTVFYVWIVCLIISIAYAFTHRDGNLLLNKISKQPLMLKVILYLLYVIFIIPAFIDIVIVIIDFIKNLKNK